MSLPTLSLQDKRDLAEALERKEKLRRAFGLRYYQPHYKQDLFHRAGAHRRRYMRTGNRFGKSDMGASEACAWAIGYRPWYELSFNVLGKGGEITRRHEGRPDHEACFFGIPRRPTKGLIIVQDWDKAHEIFTSEEDGIGRGKLFKFLPDLRKNDDGKSPGIIRATRQSTGAISTLYIRSIHGGISTIHLDTVRSFKSDGMGQESSNWDWVMVDEPCPQLMWKAVARGLVDAHGSAWFNCTPLRERWINDMFIGSPRTIIDQNNPNLFTVKGANRWVMVGSMHDNPHLSAAAKQEFISDLSEDEIETRIEGKPSHYQGLIYPQFGYAKHVYTEPPHGWKDMSTPPANYKVRFAIDPHTKNPHAVLFSATAPTGEVYFFAEIFERSLASDLARDILNITKNYDVDSAPCDWIAFEESPRDGSAMVDDFDKEGLIVHKATRALSRGILETRRALSRPNYIFFSSYLERTLYEFDCYAWDPIKEKPIDSNDHMMENFYRMVLDGLDYEAPSRMRDDKPVEARADIQSDHLALPEAVVGRSGDAWGQF